MRVSYILIASLVLSLGACTKLARKASPASAESGPVYLAKGYIKGIPKNAVIRSQIATTATYASADASGRMLRRAIVPRAVAGGRFASTQVSLPGDQQVTPAPPAGIYLCVQGTDPNDQCNPSWPTAPYNPTTNFSASWGSSSFSFDATANSMADYIILPADVPATTMVGRITNIQLNDTIPSICGVTRDSTCDEFGIVVSFFGPSDQVLPPFLPGTENTAGLWNARYDGFPTSVGLLRNDFYNNPVYPGGKYLLEAFLNIGGVDQSLSTSITLYEGSLMGNIGDPISYSDTGTYPIKVAIPALMPQTGNYYDTGLYSNGIILTYWVAQNAGPSPSPSPTPTATATATGTPSPNAITLNVPPVIVVGDNITLTGTLHFSDGTPDQLVTAAMGSCMSSDPTVISVSNCIATGQPPGGGLSADLVFCYAGVCDQKSPIVVTCAEWQADSRLGPAPALCQAI